MKNTRASMRCHCGSLEEQHCTFHHELGKFGLKDLLIKVCQTGVWTTSSSLQWGQKCCHESTGLWKIQTKAPTYK